jgi:serine/threonine protein kinase
MNEKGFVFTDFGHLHIYKQMINKKEHKYRVMSRLVREISIMEVLEDHPNIVKLYETYETADTLYIIMEYVPGYNLEEYLKSIDKSTIPEDKARDIFRQVVKAVDHCHSKWIVHRDLKVIYLIHAFIIFLLMQQF